MKEILAKELGKNLPSNGQPFSFVPFVGRREKDIYKALPSQKGGVSNQVKVVLAILLDKVGGFTFTDHSVPNALETRLKEFESLELKFGDAYYMYLMARMESFGSPFKLSLVCPACKETTNYTVETDTFKVKVAESESDLIKEITLDVPITISGKVVTKAEIKCMKFDGDFYNFDNPNEIQSAAIALNTRFVGYDFPIGNEQVEDFPIKVQRQLYNAIDEVTPGISQMLEFLCANCQRTSPYLVNWEYPSFFV